MDTQTNNPREAIGGNQVEDYAAVETVRLKDEYQGYKNTAIELKAAVDAFPEVVDSDDLALKGAALDRRIGDLDDRVKETHKVEKEPHLRRGQAVDAYFGLIRMFLYAAKKTDKAGLGDTIRSRVNAWNQKKLAEERRVRAEAERLASEEAARKERERLEAERVEREKREAAERARRPDRKAELEKEASDAAAVTAQKVADESVARADLSNARADKTAKSADLVRTRGDDGVLMTMKQVGYAEVVDSSLLDVNVLRPYFKEDHFAHALKQWAKAQQYRKPMNGASIGMRDVTDYR